MINKFKINRLLATIPEGKSPPNFNWLPNIAQTVATLFIVSAANGLSYGYLNNKIDEISRSQIEISRSLIEISTSQIEMSKSLEEISKSQDNLVSTVEMIDLKFNTVGYSCAVILAFFAGSGNAVDVLEYFDKKETERKNLKK